MKFKSVQINMKNVSYNPTHTHNYSPYRILCGSRWGTGGPDPLENYKNIGFLSNTGPDPLKNHKATKSAFNFGSLSARWWIDDEPLIY